MATSPIQIARPPRYSRFAVSQVHALVWLNAILVALRFLTAARLPLSFDESYFWLWSKHLALSYYDHPPLIALAIRAGTLALGDTEFGVRSVSLLCSVFASYAIWRAAALLAATEESGALACTIFNATLMANAEFIAATPDALVMTAAALMLFGIAKLVRTGNGRWWLAVGGAIGMALLSKYTAFFLAAGAGLWCLASRQGRPWLRTAWPYTAIAAAALCFLPALLWNAAHNWISFRFQFGRVAGDSLSYRYLPEFALAQVALASPFILIAAMVAIYRTAKHWRESPSTLAAAAVALPALIYFTLHALHARVQGNWPSFIYPALALLAASEMARPPSQQSGFLRLSNRVALPTALAILAAVHLQIWTGAISAGKQDPLARMIGIGVKDAAREIGTRAAQRHAAAIVTGKYVVTGWLSFYLPQPTAIVQIADEHRWLETPKADAALLRRPLLFVTQEPAHELAAVQAHFSNVTLVGQVARKRGNVTLDNFYMYSLSGFHGRAAGRIISGRAS